MYIYVGDYPCNDCIGGNAYVQVKRMGWRGIWMTKNIEGTVDDDIAAKLAIGEGRQVRKSFHRLTRSSSVVSANSQMVSR